MKPQASRILIFSSAAFGLVGLTLLNATKVESQPQAKSLVVLQPTSPGTPQAGNVAITGKGLFGQVDLTTANVPMGLTSEVGGNNPLLNFDLNFRQSNKNTAIAGGALRIDTRLGQPIFQFLARPAGLTTDSTLAVLTAGGKLGVGRSNPNGMIDGVSTADTGVAVSAWCNSLTGPTRALYAECQSPDGIAVTAFNSHATGLSYSMWGVIDSTNGTAILGQARASSGAAIGVRGLSSSPIGYGVYGDNSSASGVTFGVYGSVGANGSGYGVYSNGRMAVSGTKSFQIDHPLDPEHMILNHYCTEGPEPLNAYSGNAQTDSRGYATVQLPSYFESINRDFRYQLSVIDTSDSADFVLAKVVRKIADNQFTIRTSSPNIEVSWRIEATRNDRFVQQYGAPVEVEKTQSQIGSYIAPDLYGKPKEQSIFYRPVTRNEAASQRGSSHP